MIQRARLSDTEQQKQLAARAALSFLQQDMIVGIGTGSTVNALIEPRSGIFPLRPQRSAFAISSIVLSPAAASSSSPAGLRCSTTTSCSVRFALFMLAEGSGRSLGVNSFQRPKQEAPRMLGAVIEIYASAPDQN